MKPILKFIQLCGLKNGLFHSFKIEIFQKHFFLIQADSKIGNKMTLVSKHCSPSNFVPENGILFILVFFWVVERTRLPAPCEGNPKTLFQKECILNSNVCCSLAGLENSTSSMYWSFYWVKNVFHLPGMSEIVINLVFMKIIHLTSMRGVSLTWVLKDFFKDF